MTETPPAGNSEPDAPRGSLSLQTIAMPADTNPHGDIFGGWLMSQMDLAGGIAARTRTGGRIVTIAVDAMVFHKPVSVGDVVSVYAEEIRVGRTSVTFRLEAWVIWHDTMVRHKVTEARYTYVAVDENGRKRPIPAADDVLSA